MSWTDIDSFGSNKNIKRKTSHIKSHKSKEVANVYR